MDCLTLPDTHTYLISHLLVDGQFLHQGTDVDRFLFQDGLQGGQVHFHCVYKLIGL